MTTSYGNDTPVGEGLPYTTAISQAKSGFMVSRESWHRKGFVFWAVSGTFIAFDKTTGALEPFLVASIAGLNAPYQPSQEDRDARDWVVLTRQQLTRQIEPEEFDPS